MLQTAVESGEPFVVDPAVAGMSRPVLIVGGGPAGVRTAQELSRLGVDCTIFNAERWRPYNRVKLSPLLAGEAQIGQIYVDADFKGPGKVRRYDGVSVVDIDREARQVLTSSGRVFDYDKLILALGSRAFVPPIPGSDLSGVYTFRNFDDAEALVARSHRSRRVVVIGGGLLGLEAARGMSKRGTDVTVIEHENRLMPRQLDSEAGAVLKDRIETLGITVLTGERVAQIVGDHRVDSVRLASGMEIDVDTVIVCTGVRANTQLASAIGLAFNRGVLVDDELRTSDPDIFAVGECAQHDDVVCGLVGPAFEQAAVAARVIAGKGGAYAGSVPATKLKVLGADVFSMGDFESLEQQPGIRSHVFGSADGAVYRRILIDRGRIAAALGVGDWPEASRLQRAVGRREAVSRLSIRRFLREGRLWQEDTDGAASWPREAIVCNCTGVTKGAIQDACLQGACSLEDVRAATSANTVCGTCQPLVQQLLGDGETGAEAAKGWKALLAFSGSASLAALVTALLPPVPVSDSFVIEELFRSLWFDTIWKQWSGYSLLGLTAAAAMLGLRRRIPIMKYLGSWDGWRFVHLVLGGIAALVLVWHTGFRLGSNLNFLLMASFLTTLVFGAVTGFVVGGEHELRDRKWIEPASRPRSLPNWIHILALWPLPVLVIIHILAVYAY